MSNNTTATFVATLNIASKVSGLKGGNIGTVTKGYIRRTVSERVDKKVWIQFTPVEGNLLLRENGVDNVITPEDFHAVFGMEAGDVVLHIAMDKVFIVDEEGNEVLSYGADGNEQEEVWLEILNDYKSIEIEWSSGLVFSSKSDIYQGLTGARLTQTAHIPEAVITVKKQREQIGGMKVEHTELLQAVRERMLQPKAKGLEGVRSRMSGLVRPTFKMEVNEPSNEIDNSNLIDGI